MTNEKEVAEEFKMLLNNTLWRNLTKYIIILNNQENKMVCICMENRKWFTKKSPDWNQTQEKTTK